MGCEQVVRGNGADWGVPHLTKVCEARNVVGVRKVANLDAHGRGCLVSFSICNQQCLQTVL